MFSARIPRLLHNLLDRLCVPGISDDDDEYQSSKKQFAMRLHVGYLLLAPALFVFLQLSPTELSFNPLAFRIYVAVTIVFSLGAIVLYRRACKLTPLYLTMGLFGLFAPYVVWASKGDFMATTASWLPIGFAGVLLIRTMGSSLEANLALLVHIILPILALVLERVGHNPAHHREEDATVAVLCGPCELSFLLTSTVSWHRLVAWAVQCIAPYVVAFSIVSHMVTLHRFSYETAMVKQALSDRLLLNILPEPIAKQLMTQLSADTRSSKDGPSPESVSHIKCIVESHPCVTVSFSDVCGFTALSLEVSPEVLVTTLNEVFGAFDMLCLQRHVEKIKTIGDAYMMVGFPTSNDQAAQADAAIRVITVAVRMIHVVQRFSLANTALGIRIGAHSGPVVAGVIGNTKFCYDLWGPVVNLASRFESNGVRNCIQVSAETSELISTQYNCVFRDVISLKGAGNHRAFLVSMPLPKDNEEMDVPALNMTALQSIVHLSKYQDERRRSLCSVAPNTSRRSFRTPSSPTTTVTNLSGEYPLSTTRTVPPEDGIQSESGGSFRLSRATAAVSFAKKRPVVGFSLPAVISPTHAYASGHMTARSGLDTSRSNHTVGFLTARYTPNTARNQSPQTLQPTDASPKMSGVLGGFRLPSDGFSFTPVQAKPSVPPPQPNLSSGVSPQSDNNRTAAGIVGNEGIEIGWTAHTAERPAIPPLPPAPPPPRFEVEPTVESSVGILSPESAPTKSEGEGALSPLLRVCSPRSPSSLSPRFSPQKTSSADLLLPMSPSQSPPATPANIGAGPPAKRRSTATSHTAIDLLSDFVPSDSKDKLHERRQSA